MCTIPRLRSLAVMWALVVAFFPTQGRADFLDNLDLAISVAGEAKDVAPRLAAPLSAASKFTVLSIPIKMDYDLRHGNLKEYEGREYYLYANMAGQMAAGVLTRPVAQTIYITCRKTPVDCPATVISLGEGLENFQKSMGKAAETPFRVLDDYGAKAAAKEAEREAAGQPNLFESLRFENASKYEQKLLDGLQSLVNFIAPRKDLEETAENSVRGAGLTPAERDAPISCLQGRPYWEGGCFDSDDPPQFEFQDQEGPRFEDLGSAAANRGFGQGDTWEQDDDGCSPGAVQINTPNPGLCRNGRW